MNNLLTAAMIFMGLTRADLATVYSLHAPDGVTPFGRYHGYVVAGTGSEPLDTAIHKFLTLFWRGKVFSYEAGMPAGHANLVNDTIIGDRFAADVYPGDSWVDGRPTIVIDYSRGTGWESRIVRKVRDEIRPIEQGLYLGVAYWTRKKSTPLELTFFLLESDIHRLPGEGTTGENRDIPPDPRGSALRLAAEQIRPES